MNKLGIILALAISLVVVGCMQTQTQNPVNQTQTENAKVSEMVEKAVQYINSNLLRQSYNATLVNFTKYGDYLYKINLDFFKAGEKVGTNPVFITEDGDILILNKNCIREVNKTYSPDPIENAIQYINRDMVMKGVSVKLLNKTSYGRDLFRLRIGVMRNGSVAGNEEIYLTKDGKNLIIGRCLVDMYNKYNRERVPIDKDDPVLGNRSAKVVIVEFSDFACPYCAMFENNVLPNIMAKYGDEILVVFKDFPVHGEKSMQASNAARCAGEQGKYWEYHRMLFRNQMQWERNQSMFVKYAEDLNLNLTKFKACMDAKKYYNYIEKDRQEGISLGVSGTPTIFVNGIKLVGMQPYDKLSKIIEEELKKNK